MIFDAYLMRDGYTPDFYSDFVDYYQRMHSSRQEIHSIL